MPKMPATMAPSAAANEPMLSVSSRRLTSYRRALSDTPIDSSKSRAPARAHVRANAKHSHMPQEERAEHARPKHEFLARSGAALQRREGGRQAGGGKRAMALTLEQPLCLALRGAGALQVVLQQVLHLLHLGLLLLGLHHLLERLLRLEDVLLAALELLLQPAAHRETHTHA